MLMREALKAEKKTADWIARLTAIGGEAVVKTAQAASACLKPPPKRKKPPPSR